MTILVNMIKFADPALEKVINEAAECAAGFYFEKTKHHFALVFEATDAIQRRLKDMSTKDEFNELKTEVSTIRLVVTDTNEDLKALSARVSNLETDDFYA